MENRRIIKWLGLAGVLFAGFLSFRFLVLKSCGGGCSILWGLPTCVYGLVMFLAIFIASMHPAKKAMCVVRAMSVFGILFSLWYVVQELSQCVLCWELGFPNCVYGLVVYSVIAFLAFKDKFGKKSSTKKDVAKRKGKKSKKKR